MHENLIPQSKLSKEAFIFGDDALFELKSKIESVGTPLKEWDIAINYGIKTGYNEAFIIDTATKDEILNSCDDSDKSRKPFSSLRGSETTEAIHKPFSSSLRGSGDSHNEAIHSQKADCHDSATAESRNDKTPCHTDTPCHTERSEVSKNLSHCHTEHSEVSKNKGVDSSLSTKAQNDKADCHADKSACSIAMLTERERTAKLIKPILRGRDIKRYSYEWANLWLIGTFPALKINIDDYPALKKYLENFMPRIAQSGEKGCRKKTSNKWFETQDNIAYYEDFEKEKIVWNRISSELCFSYDNKGHLILDSMFMINCADKFLRHYFIGVLNSNLAKFWIKNNAATLGDGVYGAKIYIEKLPIPKITKENQNLVDELVKLVNQNLALKAENSSADTSQLECDIDNLVFKLYDLNEIEIQLIKQEQKNKDK